MHDQEARQRPLIDAMAAINPPWLALLPPRRVAPGAPCRQSWTALPRAALSLRLTRARSQLWVEAWLDNKKAAQWRLSLSKINYV
jgi:hypothetical protein